jgi:organic radical activating enzyme
MTSIRESIRRLIKPAEPLPAGVYHYQAPPEDPRNYRLHLRLEPDGDGVLIVNAATVLHLNPTAAEYAYHLVQGTNEEQAAKSMASRYRVSKDQARKDYRDLIERIDTLVTTPDLDPVTFLDFDRQVPYSGHISAPYRLDCALTYRLPESSNPEAAPARRVTRELSTEEWRTVLDKAWQAGIPHVIFTGGEPTLREDLAELITYAEINGQVTGLLTDGERLFDEAYLETLLQTGLDHLLFILQTKKEASWEALAKALAADIFIAVHLTIKPENRDHVKQILERLAEMGVKAISLSENSTGLNEVLQTAREQVAELDMSLVWDLPVPYSALNPVALEVESPTMPEGTGRAWLYVEPDGDVLPAQGINQVLGNLLTEPWEAIWKAS